jgi:hypothetical protein
MTIKRNGEKVILKGGKVSCSCCEGPGECCMYPAQALADGLYSASDLPDALSHISRNGTIRNIFRSGTDYLVADGPLGKIGAEFDATGSSIPLWLFYDDAGSQAGSRCLFQKFAGLPPGYPVEDQFADTYTASGVPAPGGGTESVSLSRISLCVWQGVDSCGGPVLLSYDGIASAGPLGTYHWYIGWEEYPFFNLFGCNSDLEAGSAEKTDPQSSPAGSYVNVNVNITVS